MQPYPPVTPKAKRTYKPRKRHSTTPEASSRQGTALLKQVQYRSYQRNISIYHFRAKYLSVAEFCSLLRRDKHGYIDCLIGTDTLAKISMPEGDKTPRHCIETAYVPNIFTQHGQRSTGSALGFRVGHKVIEWVCFDRPVDVSILNSWIATVTPDCLKVQALNVAPADDPRRLFDLVGTMPKGIQERRVRGANYEHKQWHTSLWGAKLRRMTLKLTWKSMAAQMMEYHAEEREKAKALAQAEALRLPRQEDIEEEYRDEELDVEMVGGYL